MEGEGEGLRYRGAGAKDVDEIYALEAASYPEDEAATRGGIEKRIREAGRFFVLAETTGTSVGGKGGDLAGFVNGTLTTSTELTHETMSNHEPEGSLLCVHSVVVAPALRRKGVALAMLREYVQSLRRDGENGVKEVRLICKEGLKGLYLKAGFDLVGPSPVVHGKDPWFEMKLGLH
ncbi:N-acetyltransferase [Chloropicon primus]|uniref:N-acetyltransferase n=1 Tax=Chloropicon primus TaxID=1764295 RepID=A0A5B8MR73_9CHLO|nr:N-acetyltransferase [Chloropicon primus]UPR01725.1 N-acetyltransferase [Chloropicon primus]|eukprot:QDZ22504.1 N-acetyltransferase [Chloropicon primus]